MNRKSNIKRVLPGECQSQNYRSLAGEFYYPSIIRACPVTTRPLPGNASRRFGFMLWGVKSNLTIIGRPSVTRRSPALPSASPAESAAILDKIVVSPTAKVVASPLASVQAKGKKCN